MGIYPSLALQAILHRLQSERFALLLQLIADSLTLGSFGFSSRPRSGPGYSFQAYEQ